MKYKIKRISPSKIGVFCATAWTTYFAIKFFASWVMSIVFDKGYPFNFYGFFASKEELNFLLSSTSPVWMICQILTSGFILGFFVAALYNIVSKLGASIELNLEPTEE